MITISNIIYWPDVVTRLLYFTEECCYHLLCPAKVELNIVYLLISQFFFLKSITFKYEKVRAPNICENKAPVVRSYWTFWFFPIHHHEFSSAWEVHYIFLGNKEEKVEKLLRKKYRNFGMKNCSRNFIGGGTKLVVFCRSSNNSGMLDLVPPSFSPTEKYFGILFFLGKKDWLGIYY